MRAQKGRKKIVRSSGPQNEVSSSTLQEAACVDETSEQSKVMAWAADMVDRGYPELAELWHPPLGGKRPRRAGAMLKRIGTKKGILDLFFLVPRRGYCGAVLELKKRGGKLEPEQKSWMRKLAARGYFVRACWCEYVATGWLEWYLGARDEPPTEGRWVAPEDLEDEEE